MSSKHWGEILVVADTDSGIAALEREQITKPRPMDLEGSILHQPCSTEYPASTRLSSECTAVDNTTLHTIQLQQYAKKMKGLLQTAHHQIDSQQKSGEVDNILPLAPPPPVPEFPGKELPKKSYNPLNFINKKIDGKFARGIGKPPPELHEHTARQILRMSVAVLSAHAGFETSTETVLETFVDIVHEYYLRLTRLLRSASDRQLLTGSCPFPDVIEQVLHEVGVGSMTSLHTFYQQRVLQHHAHILRQCTGLLEEYERLRCPRLPQDSARTKDPSTQDLRSKDTSIQFPVSEDSEDLVEPPEGMLHLDDLQGLEPPTSSVMQEDDAIKTEAKDPTPNLDMDEDALQVTSGSPLIGTSEYNIDAMSPPVPVFQRPAKRSRKQ